MSQINPFTGAVAQTPQQQRLQAADKAQQVRRLQNRSKNAALGNEDLEHTVESADAIVSIHDHDESPPDQRRKKQPQSPHPEGASSAEPPSHLDLTA